MAQEIDAEPGQSNALTPTKAASIATAISAAAAVVGVAGQLLVVASVGFAMLAGLGLAVLGAIVFAHQR